MIHNREQHILEEYFCPSVPISYAIEITYNCVNNCLACANIWNKKKNISLKRWRELFDKICPPDNRKKYVQAIRITGGEPTLHKELKQIVEYIDTFGIDHALFTTAMWTSDKVKEIIDIYSTCKHFAGFLVSLHGSTQEAHNAFTRGSSSAFHTIRNNIKSLTNVGYVVFTNTVLTRYSCIQVEEMINLSQKLGANHTVFNRLLGINQEINPTNKQLIDSVTLIEKLKKEGVNCSVGNCVPKCFVSNTGEGATGGIEHCAISPAGDVRPDNLTNLIFGNIFEHSIEEIWQSDKAVFFRNSTPDECYECLEFQRCRGGVKSVMIENKLDKDPLMRNPIKELEVEEIILDPEYIPIRNFEIRKEKNKYLLARYNWTMYASEEEIEVIKAIDGNNTLSCIQQKYGDDAINYIGELYNDDFIQFQKS